MAKEVNLVNPTLRAHAKRKTAVNGLTKGQRKALGVLGEALNPERTRTKGRVMKGGSFRGR